MPAAELIAPTRKVLGVSAGERVTPMRMLPGTGVWTPGWVMSSVDSGVSIGVDIRLLTGGVGVMRGVGFADDGDGSGVPVGIASSGFGNPIGSVIEGGFDTDRGRTVISPDACDIPGSLLTRFAGAGAATFDTTGGGIVASVGVRRGDLAGG